MLASILSRGLPVVIPKGYERVWNSSRSMPPSSASQWSKRMGEGRVCARDFSNFTNTPDVFRAAHIIGIKRRHDDHGARTHSAS